MPLITFGHLTLVLTFLICLSSVFTPLQAFIDHLLDFHLDVDRIPKKEDYNDVYEKDGAKYESRWFYEAQRERDQQESRGTTMEPDRDK